jgi:hypothetical protein
MIPIAKSSLHMRFSYRSRSYLDRDGWRLPLPALLRRDHILYNGREFRI